MPTWTQDKRNIAINTPLGKDVLLLKSFNFKDEMSRPFMCEIELRSQTAAVDFNKIIGENVTIRLNLTGGKVRYFNGYISRFQQEGDPVEGAANHYRATMVPWLWFLTRTADCRIFQNKSVPDIVKAMFDELDFNDYEFRLTSQYKPKEYVVQYRETAFNFVSRLLEQEGIYYFFEHENGKHLLVLTDSPAKHKAAEGYANVQYNPVTSKNIGMERVWEWTVEKRIQPGVIALVDYDFKAPTKNLYAEKSAPAGHANAGYQVFDYPGLYIEHADGQAYAAIRNEEQAAQHVAARAIGDIRGLFAGCKFKLQGYPRADQNIEHIVTLASIYASTDEWDTSKSGTGTEACKIAFSTLPAQTQFRPARTTPKPKVAGPQTAIVVGATGEEIHTDPDGFGRVKVHFHWDHRAAADENCSCWIRVCMGWAGKKWGNFFLPRTGQEVVVDFIEGDPDQPIITGRVHNNDNMPPYKLPDYKTMSTMKSLSSKGGGGFNEIRFEDKKGEEQIFVHGEKQLDIRIKQDAYEWIGATRHLIVCKSQFENIHGARHTKVGGKDLRSVGGDDNHVVKGKQHVEVEGDANLWTGGKYVAGATGDAWLTSDGKIQIGATGAIIIDSSAGITLSCGGTCVVIDSKGVTLKGPQVIADGQQVLIASGPGSSPQAYSDPSPEAAEVASGAHEADKADPGEMAKIKAEQRQSGKGKYGKTKVDPTPGGGGGGETPPPGKTWYEFKITSDDGTPIPNEKTKVILSTGAPQELTTNSDGVVKVETDEGVSAEAGYPNYTDPEWRPQGVEEV
ncbi:MAG: type VI secretion system tip protein VgrG [Leptolyngbya sp. PLA1]|nr:type VI secretion system tip protein VgrG [Leptolyngbya sp. PLA1]